ncbi:alpha/beta hydrolase [Flagellimonas meridianipacifica]|uniref:Phospholipase/carboxylesterase n=1 Tax=Flagellimonas meridianipacifica TaxID=1080225 RepID=A0A2T0MCA8_9FLAO|nr:alpha/beta fold hydrolase [Allomuricauda pacifica]PRX55115.1 phospholipase/carboxylesterase [Allomuricauda pacifica]
MSPTSLSLTYLVQPSKIQNSKTPAIFMFHGYGSNEEDLFSFAPELPEEFTIFSVRAPFSLEPFGYAWYAINFDAEYGKWSDDQQAIESRDKILAFIDEAIEAYQLDADNITLLGFSQGTILSYSVALSYPEKVKNIVALSGYINEKILLDGYKTKNLKHLNFYASHGQVDQVIPLEWAQKTPEILENLGIPFKYEEFPVGHGVSPQNFYSFKTWLEERI